MTPLSLRLAEHDILVLGGKRVRLVTHLGIGGEDIDYVVERMQNLSGNTASLSGVSRIISSGYLLVTYY